MMRPTRNLGAAATLAALVVLLGGVGPGAAKPAAPPVSVARAEMPDSSAARRVSSDSVDFESAEGDSFGPPQLFLAWHAPYGMPGATDTISFGAGDSNRVDTLFLSFETGRDTRRFLGMMARLYFHPAFGDTLGIYWRYDYRSPNNRQVAIEFDPDGSFPCPQPWIRKGMGFPEFKFYSGGAKLELYYVVTRPEDIVPVDGRVRYCFARVMFRQTHWDLAGARQPVCIEWSLARMSAGRRDVVGRRGAGRCVSVNSADRSVCRPYRRTLIPDTWIPVANRPRTGTP
jgi:hypothetical protein